MPASKLCRVYHPSSAAQRAFRYSQFFDAEHGSHWHNRKPLIIEADHLTLKCDKDTPLLLLIATSEAIKSASIPLKTN